MLLGSGALLPVDGRGLVLGSLAADAVEATGASAEGAVVGASPGSGLLVGTSESGEFTSGVEWLGRSDFSVQATNSRRVRLERTSGLRRGE